MNTLTTVENTARTLTTAEMGQLADKAYAGYDFGDGVTITDHGGWEYSVPGYEWSRKVYVETAAENDGPAPRWTLNFTVHFNPADGSFKDACALDQKGSIWGGLPTLPELPDTVQDAPAPEAALAEVLPGATVQEIDQVMMQDLVGDYEVPSQVPEWAWVEENACFSHKYNGQFGVWEFVLNLSSFDENVPEKLKSTIKNALDKGIAYIIFHQGT